MGTRGRARRLVAGLAFVALLATLALPAAAAVDPELLEARHELQETKERLHARHERLRGLQRDLNELATRISRTSDTINQTWEEMAKLRAEIGPLHSRLARLETRLAERSREAYIMGPGAPMLFLLTATSAEQVASRMSLLDEMSRRDGVLALKVGQARDRLARTRDALSRAQTSRRLLLDALAADRKEMKEKMAEISLIRPFAVCPVQGPHAIADDFGIWVHHPKDEGGNHVHQGNDIMAPGGTPIVAPFDGLAVDATNKIGGNAVKVYGQFGYVYNAHMSAFGTLGQVETGTVIGYVGATGNTGANHDHFEWHPDNGPAVDPHEFLLKVC
ncbi:MAG TPA: peptidoglycan DD-metalloendopeptidase family protein [Actinomycetota bacterium]|nr:peptidoglycan DD-metalloendopeptidase family protein [Actinomycetota bacterium]